MVDYRGKSPPRPTRMTLGGQVLYDSEQPISDAERIRRIKRALLNVGWKREGGDRTAPVARGVAQPPEPPGRIVSGELLPARTRRGRRAPSQWSPRPWAGVRTRG